MNIFKIKDLYESLGKEKFTQEIDRRIKDPDIKLFENASDRDWHDLYEAVDSKTFTYLIGSRIALTVRDGYTMAVNPLEPIFTIKPSNMAKERVVGLIGPKGLEEVKEGMRYEAKGISELKLDFENTKYGELVEITEEVVRFDRYNAVIDAAREVGENAKYKLAELYAAALLDVDSEGYDGSGIYTNGHGNLGTTALAAAALETAIKTMREFTDDNGKKVQIIPKWLVTCEDLRIPALKLIKSILEPGTVDNDYNILKDEGLEIISVPFWTATDTTWILVGTKGGAGRGFVYQEVFPIETYSQKGQGTDAGFEKDVISRFKVRLMGAATCRDWRYSYKGKV